MNHEPMTSDGVVSDAEAHATSVFLASLATLNTDIAKYILRESDASSEPTPLADELALAEHLATAAAGLCAQIRRRQQLRHGGC